MSTEQACHVCGCVPMDGERHVAPSDFVVAGAVSFACHVRRDNPTLRIHIMEPWDSMDGEMFAGLPEHHQASNLPRRKK